MKSKTPLRSFLALSGSALLVVSSVNATQYWDGTGGDANWNTAANWGADAVPAFGTTLINFGGANAGGTAAGTIAALQTSMNNDFAAAFSIKAILFTNNGTSGRTQAFTLDGNSITLGDATNLGITTTALTTGSAIEDVIKLNIIIPTAAQNRVFNTGTNHNLKVEGVISGGSHMLKSGGPVSKLTLTGANSYTGMTNIQEGVLEITSVADGGVNSSIGASTSASANLQFGNAVNTATAKTLRYIGSTNGSTNRAFQIAGNVAAGTHSYIESSGIGTLSFTSSSAITYTNTGVPRNFYLGGTNAGDNGFNLALGNNGAGVTTFTKQGASKWILSGTNTHTGATKIEGGTLQFARQVSLYNNDTAGTGWTAANIYVAGTGTLALNVGGTGEFTTGNVTTLLGNLGGANGTSTTGFAAGSAIGLDTTNAGGSFTVGDVIADSTGTGGGAIGLTKLGTGALVLSNTSTYSGMTIVSAGTLFVTGNLSSSATTVQTTGAIGSNGAAGTLGSGLTIAAGGYLDLTGATLGLNSTNILSLTGGSLTLGNLTFLDLVGWDWANAAAGTYELIDGAFTVDFGSTAYLSAGAAYDFGNGKKGYFTAGSLNAVIVAIPEPHAALLAGLGLLVLLRRRRA